MKTSNEQIQTARAALARALARQRREDAHQKIVIGATAWGWLCKNPQAAAAFIRHVQAADVRPQDRPALDAAIAELQRTLPQQPTQPRQQ